MYGLKPSLQAAMLLFLFSHGLIAEALLFSTALTKRRGDPTNHVLLHGGHAGAFSIFMLDDIPPHIGFGDTRVVSKGSSACDDHSAARCWSRLLLSRGVPSFGGARAELGRDLNPKEKKRIREHFVEGCKTRVR